MLEKAFSFNTLEHERQLRTLSSEGSSYPHLHRLVEPHIKSFNSIMEDGLLENAVKNLDVRVIRDPFNNRLSFWLEDLQLSKPMVPDKERYSINRFVYPSECRQRGVSYTGKLTGTLCYQVNDGPIESLSRAFGDVPLLVKSNRCHLEGESPMNLVRLHEESEELGGYFIVNGIERLIRLLIVTRRNYPLGVSRPSYTKKGSQYTQFGVIMRCVRDDETSCTITLHYLNDGSINLRFIYHKQEFFIPILLILKALKPTNDKEIYTGIVQGQYENTFLTGRVEGLLRDFKRFKLYTRSACLAYIGARFSGMLRHNDDLNDEEIGELLLKKMILVHLSSKNEKFYMLLFMCQKLYALANGKCLIDNMDSPMNQEILLGGYLYCGFIKDRLDEFLFSLRSSIQTDLMRNKTMFGAEENNNNKWMRKMVSRSSYNVGQKLKYFVGTGNLVSLSGLDLSQATGYTIVAERLNFYRYLSHFRSVHRGAFFAELKTTTVRKLLPEAWGFLCPVHTPDGAPCGLLNHLSHTCEIAMDLFIDVDQLPITLCMLGMSPIQKSFEVNKDDIIVQVNGKVVGYISSLKAASFIRDLRHLKTKGLHGVPKELEIGLVLPSNGGTYPGIYMFTSPSRMMRPVVSLNTGTVEYIGTLEQVFLNIAVSNEEITDGESTHVEISPTHIFSVLANLTPFSDFNQSPRNMYQCQMSKQSMGTPFHSFPYRTDSKTYRLNFPQAPIVRSKLNDLYGIGMYPNGMNAVVAVISYTGYDMEDAMIINKGSFERGFGHGTIYNTEFKDINEHNRASSGKYFQTIEEALVDAGKIDRDGLPYPGSKVSFNDPLFSIVDPITDSAKISMYKESEEAYIDTVTLIGDEYGESFCSKVAVKYRYNRNPVIGDKFSSRHGQKGVLSQKWPMTDMPFSESGIVPDIIINPHAFPSRMTIGMFVESLAGKAGALHGLCQDGAPFQFSEDQTAADYFGEQLRAAGYNYHGNEPMYSGVTGVEMSVDIYIGVVYYQRLRHMVSDKYQMRTTGPVHILTHQPIKGRKKAGGIRFGEMERDSFLAHGISFLLQDRLMNCSDYTQITFCKGCGGFLSITYSPKMTQEVCTFCNKSDELTTIALPYVFKYLATELMAMNIRLTLALKN